MQNLDREAYETYRTWKNRDRVSEMGCAAGESVVGVLPMMKSPKNPNTDGNFVHNQEKGDEGIV